MAKLAAMPQQSIIDGLKGVLDFYYYKGTPSVRRWPRIPEHIPSSVELAAREAFAYINSLAPDLPSSVIRGFQFLSLPSTLAWRDWLVRVYLHGISY